MSTSLPIRGAWIEIRRRISIGAAPYSRSPSGERGLKYLLQGFFKSGGPVAPHPGSVD